MTPISSAEFEDLLANFASTAWHLETRDAYGTAIELPYMAKWAAGEPDDLAWLQDWCSFIRDGRKAGRSVRRARIVSEPLSDYQRWSHSIAHPMVEAGEDIRWVPRRRVSAIGLPGNDFYLFDHDRHDARVVFLLYSGNGLATEWWLSDRPAVLGLTRIAFEAVWDQSIPHGEYQPAP